MACCYVDPAHWFLNRWGFTAFLGPASIHDLAYQPRQLCPVQHFAFAAIRRYRNLRRSQPRKIFRLRLHWFLFVV